MNNLSVSFKSKFLPSRTTKEVDAYAKELGYNDFTKNLNKALKPHRNFRFHIKHHYSKPRKLTKTEISYEKDGTLYKHVEFDSNVTNPAELTFKMMLSLKDVKSRLFAKIFRDYN